MLAWLAMTAINAAATIWLSSYKFFQVVSHRDRLGDLHGKPE